MSPQQRAVQHSVRNHQTLLLPEHVGLGSELISGLLRADDPIPDDHSAVEPRLPIPNRTVKRSRADDSAGYTARK